jgi:hypothetical protein
MRGTTRIALSGGNTVIPVNARTHLLGNAKRPRREEMLIAI